MGINFFFDLEVIAVGPIGFYSDISGEGRGYSVPEEKQAIWAAWSRQGSG